MDGCPTEEGHACLGMAHRPIGVAQIPDYSFPWGKKCRKISLTAGVPHSSEEHTGWDSLPSCSKDFRPEAAISFTFLSKLSSSLSECLLQTNTAVSELCLYKPSVLIEQNWKKVFGCQNCLTSFFRSPRFVFPRAADILSPRCLRLIGQWQKVPSVSHNSLKQSLMSHWLFRQSHKHPNLLKTNHEAVRDVMTFASNWASYPFLLTTRYPFPDYLGDTVEVLDLCLVTAIKLAKSEKWNYILERQRSYNGYCFLLSHPLPSNPDYFSTASVRFKLYRIQNRK